MLNSYKKYIPQPFRNVAREILFPPNYFYAKKTLSMYLKGKNHDACTLPVLDNYREYENLFGKAEDNFKEIVTPFITEFRWLIGRIYNGTFESVDVEVYYSIIRKYQPKLIIEIGSGHSTCFALDAIKRNKRGSIISITLEPRRKLPQSVKCIRSKVEEVGIDIFEQLSENDILFIDSSHTTAEAIYHTEKILPILNSGVIIHHHDILYPYNVYYMNDSKIFAEPDVILNFYLENTDTYKIVTSTSYVPYRNLELVKRLVESFNWDLKRRPGSLWVRKR